LRPSSQSEDRDGEWLFNVVMDIDKHSARYMPGGGVEFGTGDEGMAARFEIVYIIDSVATLPSRDIESDASPRSEVILGYRYVPGAGI
jgi:hypothetical protein